MDITKNYKITKRAVIVTIVFSLAMLMMFSRFVYIQASKEVQDVDLEGLLEARWTQTLPIEGERGNITDRNGEVLAEEIPSYTIVAILDERFDSFVEDPETSAEKLAPILGADVDYLEAQLSRDAVQVELGAAAKNLSYEKMDEIDSLGLPGITFREDPRRYYPKQTFASHIIGYTERDMSEARMGVEESLNTFLQGEAGSIQYQRDGRGRQLPQDEEIIQEPEHGDDVMLTIDSRIQTAMEQTMNQADELYDPDRMMAVVANAKTGEILGMSNRPSFNPNEYEDIENYTNFNISSRFEPGSTMKIFTLAAAIEEGVYDGEAEFESGTYQVTDRTIRDHNNGEGWGEISFNEGVQRSSNVAFSKIAMEILGPDKLYEYIDKFGFREPTGIDLPNEVNGGQIAETYAIDAATTSFGQATSISPMQQVKAATAIANDGKMMKPYVISEIIDSGSGETVQKKEPQVDGEPISEETAREVREIMETVVSGEEGTGGAYAVDGFEVAGKTGTAQIPKEDGRGYMSGHGKNIYSFIGMAPADDPEVIVFVAVDRPDLELNEYGNQPVSLIFRQVMEQSLQYLNIPATPDEGEEEERSSYDMPDVTGEPVEETASALDEAGMNIVKLGSGRRVEAQSHNPGTPLAPGERVILKTTGEAEMPDVEGWSLRSIQQLAVMLDAELEYEGVGFAAFQEPSPGTPLNELEHIRTVLGEAEAVDEAEEDPAEPENSSEE